MILKILKIKNLGLVFSDYSWGSNLSLFKRFNLIYGWNGSGKTTFSRLFDAIDGHTLPNLEYEIEGENGVRYREGEVFRKKIRVFNQDYIQKNVKIIESQVNSISILLGEENKDLIQKIEEDRVLLNGSPADPLNPGKLSKQAEYLAEKNRKTNEHGGKFTEIARIIGAAIGGNALRDYRKPQAERDFSALTEKVDLNDDELETLSLSAKQESLPAVDEVVAKKLKNSDGVDCETSIILKSVTEEAKSALIKTVESEVIPRLISNEDISIWIEEGLHLHANHKSQVCEYCLQEIPILRIQQIASHFNDADKALKNKLDILVERLEEIKGSIQAIKVPDRARFYTDLQTIYDGKVTNFEAEKQKFILAIESLIGAVREKKSKTTEAIILEINPSSSDFESCMNDINQTIDTHNKKTLDFEKVKEDSIKKLKLHYLSSIFDEVSLLEESITTLNGDLILLSKEIADIQRAIDENMTQISSEHKACDEINKKLTAFLGHQELSFIPNIVKKSDESGQEREVITGYRIMRGNIPAQYLSEGEKMAIAFVYFVVHLGDQEFDVNEGIIVIDDPISSLDSNSLYQAFSFLKNAVKNSKQVFILTHNFDFLKLLINWRRGADRGTNTGYYMIKNNFLGDVRCAYIDKMDRELCEYESEYHYLFKLLKQLRDEQDDSIAKAYPVPNIARKVWDTFLMFSVPNGQNSYKKMEELKANGFDELKLDAIYKFTNDQSHITGSGFDPSLVPGTKKAVKEIFEMMQEISPAHFKIIDNVTN